MKISNMKLFLLTLSLLFPVIVFSQPVTPVNQDTIKVVPPKIPSVTGVPDSSENLVPQPTFICPFEKLSLSPGMSSEEVKLLQSILAQDPSIYPQGIISGYYGNLTTEAVKRLQQKLGLPSTGIVDEKLKDFIFPCLKIRVVYPNGGEIWKIGDTVEIKWEIEPPFYLLQKERVEIKERGGSPSQIQLKPISPGSVENLPKLENAPPPFIFKRVSVDLIKYNEIMPLVYPAPVYYHIGDVSFSDRSFIWTIPSTIEESKNYKIRVTLNQHFPEPCKNQPCPLLPQTYPPKLIGYLWDESDNFFAIFKEVSPTSTPSPPSDKEKLLELKKQLLLALENIKEALKLIDHLLK